MREGIGKRHGIIYTPQGCAQSVYFPHTDSWLALSGTGSQCADKAPAAWQSVATMPRVGAVAQSQPLPSPHPVIAPSLQFSRPILPFQVSMVRGWWPLLSHKRWRRIVQREPLYLRFSRESSTQTRSSLSRYMPASPHLYTWSIGPRGSRIGPRQWSSPLGARGSDLACIAISGYVDASHKFYACVVVCAVRILPP